MSWSDIGVVAPTELAGPRLVLHWAAQIVSAAGTSLLPARDDFSHTSLGWDDRAAALVGQPLHAMGLRAGLSFERFSLILLNATSHVLDEQALAGVTLDGATSWLSSRLSERLGAATTLARPTHDMPAHAVEQGAPFVAPQGASLAELAQWFGNSACDLERICGAHASSPVRCWPHHFDIATLITLDHDESAEHARSVGVGMTPGDAGCTEPYLYVTPWPYPPSDARRPPLPVGHWHDQGWTGAVLTGSELLAAVRDHHVVVQSFLDAAVAGCHELVGYQLG